MILHTKGLKNAYRLHSITFERIEFVNSSVDPPDQITDLICSFGDDMRYFKLQNITRSYDTVYDFTRLWLMPNLGGFKLQSVPDLVVLDHTIMVPAKNFVKNEKDKEMGIFISNVQITIPVLNQVTFWFREDLQPKDEVT